MEIQMSVKRSGAAVVTIIAVCNVSSFTIGTDLFTDIWISFSITIKILTYVMTVVVVRFFFAGNETGGSCYLFSHQCCGIFAKSMVHVDTVTGKMTVTHDGSTIDWGRWCITWAGALVVSCISSTAINSLVAVRSPDASMSMRRANLMTNLVSHNADGPAVCWRLAECSA